MADERWRVVTREEHRAQVRDLILSLGAVVLTTLPLAAILWHILTTTQF